MIRCTKCGTINEPDATFCTECDAFLEWEGEKVDEAPAAPPPPGDGGTVRAQQPGPPPTPVGGPTPTTPPGSGRPPPPLPTPPPPAISTPATARPPSDQPSARKPEKTPATPKPKPKPAAPAKVEKPKPGDLVCPNCGTGNDPVRKFCRKCGSSLIAAPVEPEVAPLPWYRRLSRRSGSDATYAAGERPGEMGKRRRRPGCLPIVLVIVLLITVLAVLAYVLNDDARSAVDDTARTVECRVLEQISPPTAASVISPAEGEYGYPAFDAFSNTEWRATRTNENGAFIVEIELDEPSFVHRIEVTSAAAEPRPQTVRIREGLRVIGRATLPNDAATHSVDVCRGGLRRFSFRIVDTHPLGATTAGVSSIVVVVRQ